jgi:hypothetical protein
MPVKFTIKEFAIITANRMLAKSLILLFAFPSCVIAQQSTSIIQVIITGSHKPDKAYLLQAGAPQKEFDFTDGTVVIPDTIDHPLVATVMVTYKGEENKRYTYAFYAEPGELIMHINRDDTAQPVLLSGPPLSQDFQDQLWGPVLNYNHHISILQTQLKRTRADSTDIKTDLKKATALCFDVPRNYVRKNPNSPLAIVALRMMGKGDPTVDHPFLELADLFKSLSPTIQNSEEGKAYAVALDKLLHS